MADFSKFVWEKEYSWWTGETEIATSISVEVRILANDENEADRISKAEILFEKIRTAENDIREFAADQFLENPEYEQLENDGKKISREEFCARIKLTSVTFYLDGSVEVYFSDDDLFWGHVLVVQIDKDFNFEDSYLAG